MTTETKYRELGMDECPHMANGDEVFALDATWCTTCMRGQFTVDEIRQMNMGAGDFTPTKYRRPVKAVKKGGEG